MLGDPELISGLSKVKIFKFSKSTDSYTLPCIGEKKVSANA